MEQLKDEILFSIWQHLTIPECALLAQTCRRVAILWRNDRALVCRQREDAEFPFLKNAGQLFFTIADPLPDDPCARYVKLCRARRLLPGIKTIPETDSTTGEASGAAAEKELDVSTFDGLLTFRQAALAACGDADRWVQFIRHHERLQFVISAASAFLPLARSQLEGELWGVQIHELEDVATLLAMTAHMKSVRIAAVPILFSKPGISFVL